MTMLTRDLRIGAWYGDQPLALEFEDGWEVTTHWPDTPPPLSDQQIIQALERPVGQPPIRELARGSSRPLVIVDDLTRPTPAGRLLPFVLRHLADAGVSAGSVRVLLATGTHGPPPSLDGLARKLGPEAASACQLLVHDHTRAAVKVGRTSFGTPVLVNREVVDSDLLIGIGGIYPQHSTGFGGGSKLALGVLSKRSIIALHYGHPSVDGSYDVHNDFRRDLDEVAALIGLRTTISVHLDAERQVVRVVSGDHRRYYEAAVDFSLRRYRAPMPGDADLIISNAYPMDVSLTFVHSKGVIPLLHARPGASRVLIAACSEGVGHHGLFPFINGHRFQWPLHMARKVRARPMVATEKVTRWMRSKVRRGDGGTPEATPGSTASNPIWLFAPAAAADSLPPVIPGMTRVGSWPELLMRVRAEQGDRPLAVGVYPCAPLQVLDL
jgi:nickel-dependent lactate racemase